MWINKRATLVDETEITVSWENLPSITVKVICDQSGLLQIGECEHGNVLFYQCTLMGWTNGDQWRKRYD